MSKEKRRTLCLTFPHNLVLFLDDVRWQVLKKSGAHKKLNRMNVLRSMARAFKEADFDLSGVRTEDEFVSRLLDQIQERRPKNRKNGRKNRRKD